MGDKRSSERLRNYSSLIRCEHVCDPVPEKTKEKAAKILEAYGSNALGLAFLPNWSDTKTMDPPSGFSLSLNLNTPLNPMAFSDNKMLQGSCAIRLDANKVKFKNGMPLTLENVYNNMSKFQNNIVKFLPDNSKAPISKEHKDSYDVEKWEHALGPSASFAGLYSSRENEGYKNKKSFWLVVHSTPEHISNQLYRLIDELHHDKPNTTFKDLFFGEHSKDVKYLYNAARRNRNACLASLASSLDLHLNFDNDIYDVGSSKRQLLHPIVETETNTIVRYDGGLVYHAGTTDPINSSNGIIFNQNPYLGSVIMKGPPSNSKQYGSEWKGLVDTFGAVPVNTGRVKPHDKIVESDFIADELDRKTFIAETVNSKYKKKLSNGVYRLRTDEFKKIQNKLGHDSTWGEIALEPLCVKISTQ